MNYTKDELEQIAVGKMPPNLRTQGRLAADALAWREIAENMAAELQRLRQVVNAVDADLIDLELAAYERAVKS